MSFCNIKNEKYRRVARTYFVSHGHFFRAFFAMSFLALSSSGKVVSITKYLRELITEVSFMWTVEKSAFPSATMSRKQTSNLSWFAKKQKKKSKKSTKMHVFFLWFATVSLIWLLLCTARLQGPRYIFSGNKQPFLTNSKDKNCLVFISKPPRK